MPTSSAFFFHQFVSSPSIYDIVFSCLNHAERAQFKRVSRGATAAVDHFIRRAHNLNEYLKQYFGDRHLSFRSLQARTGTLISGSAALQILDQVVYPESDLDIYVDLRHTLEVARWLDIEGGYSFLPNSGEIQKPFYEEVILERLARQEAVSKEWNQVEATDSDEDSDEEPIMHYKFRGLVLVLSFEKTMPDDAKRKVQIICAKHSPIEVILQFHSTCVMNLISFENIYSLYPYTTFVERETLKIAYEGDSQTRALRRYEKRGWKTLRLPPFQDQVGRRKWSPLCEGLRSIGDKYTLTIPLDTTGVDATSPYFAEPLHDGVAAHSWRLKYVYVHKVCDAAIHKVTVWASSGLRYRYLIEPPYNEQVRGVFAAERALKANASTFKYADMRMSAHMKRIYAGATVAPGSEMVLK